MGRATRGQTIGTGIISAIKIVIGIVVIVLFKEIFDVYHKMVLTEDHTEPSITYWWIFGMPFIVPGVMGLVAAGFKNSVSYGLYMTCCIISMVVDGVFCAVAFVWLFDMAAIGGLDCVTVGTQCICSTGNQPGYDHNFGFITMAPITVGDCDGINQLVHMSYGSAALMIIGWVLCLAGSIVSCAACCCGQRVNQQVVMMPSYPGQVSVTTHQYSGPGYAAPPQQMLSPGYAAPPQQMLGPGYAAPPQQMPGDDTNEKNQYRYGRIC